jgi:hypothetical protein
MNMALMGALVGGGVALFLFLAEYVSVRNEASERARRKNQKLTLDDTERKRMASNARFCLLIPPAFAAFFWLVWG